MAAIVLVFAIAMGSYYLIEQPFLRLKKRTDRWFVARSLEPALAAVTAGGPTGAMSDEAEPKDVISASPVA